MLCQSCYDVLTSYLIHSPGHGGATQYMTHHISLESFEQSVVARCQICSVIAESIDFAPSGTAVSRFARLPFQRLLSAIVHFKEPEVFIVDTDGMTPLNKAKSHRLRPKGPIFTEFQGCIMDEVLRSSSISFVVRDENDRHAPFSKVGRDRETFMIQPCEELEGVVQDRDTPRSSNTGSASCLDQVREWYDHCLQNHTVCRFGNAGSVYHPTRLLDIGDGLQAKDFIYLIEPQKIETVNKLALPYMTLSHCWGNISLLQHTALTSASLRAGIATSSLPPTFQDVVKVARHLKCRYLWIDSLCIIQDDPKDWGTESVLMHKVYSHAFCNIAATGSANSLGGLFHERDPAFAQPCIFDFKSKAKPAESHLILPKSVRMPGLELEPLQKRGWVLQERRLARRLIDFTSKEILWQCRETHASESFPFGFPPRAEVQVEESMAVILSRSMSDYSAAMWIDYAYIFLSWSDIVSNYSQRLLTRVEDKLIAISGIAKQIYEKTKSQYFAGLWLDAFPQQLLWYITLPEKPRNPLAGRSSVYRAPSWSWASVDGAVYWGGSLQQNIEEKVVVDVLDISITPRLEDSLFGEVTTGHLKLRAHLWQIGLRWEKNTSLTKLTVFDVNTHADLSLQLNVYLDVIRNETQELRNLYCMPVQFTRQDGEGLRLEGLILEQVDSDEEKYSRIGYYHEGLKYAKVYYSIKNKGDGFEGRREVLIL